MIIRQYLKDIPINEDEDDNDCRVYTLVDGKKVPNHGHWEYLDDDGTVASKGTFIDGYQEGAWQVFHPNGSPCIRNFFLRGDFFPEVPLMGDETIMVPKMEYYAIEYNNIDEIEDEGLKARAESFITMESLKIAMEKIMKLPTDTVKPFFFYELYAFVTREAKRDELYIWTHFNDKGKSFLKEEVEKTIDLWFDFYTGELEDEYFKETISWINDVKKERGLRKLYAG